MTVQNNDIINLGPLAPYYSRSKERLYQPFALKMNLSFHHVLLSDDDNSSSDDEVTSVHEAPSHHEHPDRLQMIRGHEVIEVSDEESEMSNDEDHDEDTLGPTTSQTIIIDLTENEVEQRAEEVSEQYELLPHVAFAECDESSSGEEVDEELDENEFADLEDDMESIDKDSIFGDNDSNAPSEHPIEREPVASSFSPNFHLNNGPDPDFFREDLDFDMNVIEDASEEDEEDVDYEPGLGKHQTPFVSYELSDFQEDEAHRIREKERILEKARKIHDAMTQEQQQQEAKLCAAPVEAEKLKDMMMQDQKHTQAEVLVSFEAEQRIAREAHQKMAHHKAQEVQGLELARQQILIKERNKKRFEDLIVKANTPTQESIVASQMRNQNTTAVHQQCRVIHHTYMPPPAGPHSGTHEDFYPDEPFDFSATDPQNLSPVPKQCNPMLNSATELSSHQAGIIIQPPHHSFDEFAAARDENTRTVARKMVHSQQPLPPTLLMSSSVFGQPIEAGMTLPPPTLRPKVDRYVRLRVPGLPDSQEAAQKYLAVFADEHSSWRARQNGKVSINDLVDHDEEDEDSSDEELTVVVERELSKPISDDSPAAGMQKNGSGYAMLKHFNAPIPLSYTPESAHWKENQNETNEEPSSSSLVTNASKLNAKVGDDKSEPFTPLTPSTPSKKRKHVEFEERDTIISPASEPTQESYTSMPTDFDGVPISSAHCNTHNIIMASINSELDADTTASAAYTASVTSAADSPVQKHVHFASPPVTREQGEPLNQGEMTVVQRPIATPTRPSERLKMMKKAGEKAAYVLAGAAVASVGIFAALVSTAPEDF